MSKKMNKINEVANFTNSFVKTAQFKFNTAGQFKILLAIVAQIDSKKKECPMTGMLSLGQIALLTKNDGYKKSRSVKERVQERIDNMMARNTVTFDSLEVKGMKDYQVFIESIKAKEIDGTIFYEWSIHEDMRPHVTGLIENFVQIALPKSMRSTHSIRFLMLALAHHNHHKRYAPNGVTNLELSIKELKRILNIEGRYKAFDNLRRRIVEPTVSEINNSGFLFIQHYKFIKTGRKITGIEFNFQDEIFTKIHQGEQKLPVPKKATSKEASEKEISRLTRAELKAFEYLEKKGVFGGIALKQIVKKMPSSECEGYEDIYVKTAWGAFEKRSRHKTTEGRAGAFVKWWQKGEFKTKLFSEVIEKLVAKRKEQSADARVNREEAQGITNTEFEQLQQQRKAAEKNEQKKQKSVASVSLSQSRPEKRGGGFTGLGDLLGKVMPKQRRTKNDKEVFTPELYHVWREQPENQEAYRRIVKEKNDFFEEHFGGAGTTIEMRKNIIDNSVYQACKAFYDQN